MASSDERYQFETLVSAHYEPLYRFAFSLARNEADACDLVQETFSIWAEKGHQLKDRSKVKTWLFTTLHREFLALARRQTRFPHIGLEAEDAILPTVSPLTERFDSGQVLLALGKIDEIFQAPVALFYLQDCSYVEIAEILEVPVGTVKSRLSRGIERLHQLLAARKTGPINQ